MISNYCSAHPRHLAGPAGNRPIRASTDGVLEGALRVTPSGARTDGPPPSTQSRRAGISAALRHSALSTQHPALSPGSVEGSTAFQLSPGAPGSALRFDIQKSAFSNLFAPSPSCGLRAAAEDDCVAEGGPRFACPVSHRPSKPSALSRSGGSPTSPSAPPATSISLTCADSWASPRRPGRAGLLIREAGEGRRRRVQGEQGRGRLRRCLETRLLRLCPVPLTEAGIEGAECPRFRLAPCAGACP